MSLQGKYFIIETKKTDKSMTFFLFPHFFICCSHQNHQSDSYLTEKLWFSNQPQTISDVGFHNHIDCEFLRTQQLPNWQRIEFAHTKTLNFYSRTELPDKFVQPIFTQNYLKICPIVLLLIVVDIIMDAMFQPNTLWPSTGVYCFN